MRHFPTQVRKDVAVVGRSCRLPGAPDISRLWDLLEAGRCVVSQIPADRWPQSRFGHPRTKERGRSYTWAAGVLDDIWGFDPGVFRISPREAEQIDPQQRLMLELVFEACEDAGIPPSRLGGSGAGVYVGASALGGAERAQVVELLGSFEGVNTAAVASLTGDADEPR